MFSSNHLNPMYKGGLKRSIGDLPLDVLIELFSWLDSIDILRLQQCNRVLRKICNLRTVWLNAYRLLLHKHSLLENLPLDGFTILDLKQAALNPTAFIRVLQKANNEVLRAERVSILTHPRGLIFETAVLVPGGRFLFTFTENTIQLWNLGNSTRSVMPSQPVAECDLGEDQLDTMKQPLVMKENNDLFIVLATTSFDGEATPVNSKLHFITCSPESGGFTSRAILKFTPIEYSLLYWEGACLTGVLLAMPLVNDIIIWSFWDQKSITLQGEIGSLEIHDFYSHTVIACSDEALIDDYIISTGGGTIRVYKLPELADIEHRKKVPAPPALCVSTAPYIYSQAMIPAAWNKRISPPDGRGVLAFDCLSHNHTRDETIVCRYTITDTAPPAPHVESPIPCIVPERRDTSVLGTVRHMDLEGTLVSYDLDDELRAVVWVGPANQLRYQLTTPGKDGIRKVHESRILYAWHRSIDNPVFSVCPISGRVCVVTKEGEIRIMDFVPLLS